MILYHYTSTQHLPKIMGGGVLLTTENNLRAAKIVGGVDVNANKGRGVVWLTDVAEPEGDPFAMRGSAVDKYAVRITVEVPDKEALRWDKYVAKRNGEKRVFEALSRDLAWRRVRVVERRIYADEWREVRVSDDVIDLPTEWERTPHDGSVDIRTNIGAEAVRLGID
ncbi:hypothetical protein [Tsukamurella pseudospumae]|uniref:Uncharacterized protein n=1 Tax=Tsukamurella pseudospumae TaxID=239498 RepID=A0A138A7G5_9ACTN|nr:hypothetical protein [Tsukamurella pseudospumae]KXP06388.1 hypothetical protein AXK60_09805 [Tsukamurella pseudospumae]